MSINQNLPTRVANVKLTKVELEAPKTLNEMLSLPAIEKRWVETYKNSSGKPDGALRFEAEKILFSQAIATNPSFNECDRFTVYAAFIELAISGLTLRDGLSYIIPYGKKAQWQPGWKGRLEQILEIPTVVHVHEPQVVFEGDTFVYEKGMKTIIHKHIPMDSRPKNATIKYVYLIVEFNYGAMVYMMDREEVLNIRNNYSTSYKSYIKDLAKPHNKDRKVGDKLLIKYKDKQTGEWKEYESDDLPMWISDEIQAWKKTLVKRTYNNLPKLPKHKALDDKLVAFYQENPDAQQIDPDEAITYAAQENAVNEMINSGLKMDDVDEDTGEITPHEEIKDEPKEEKTNKAKPKKAEQKKETESTAQETKQFDEIPEGGF